MRKMLILAALAGCGGDGGSDSEEAVEESLEQMQEAWDALLITVTVYNLDSISYDVDLGWDEWDGAAWVWKQSPLLTAAPGTAFKPFVPVEGRVYYLVLHLSGWVLDYSPPFEGTYSISIADGQFGS
jgi:hypothetical protein